jgi:hypothetical protein
MRRVPEPYTLPAPVTQVLVSGGLNEAYDYPMNTYALSGVPNAHCEARSRRAYFKED